MEDLVYTIIRNAVGLEEGFVLTDDMKLQDIPNLDSLGQARLVMEIDNVIERGLNMDEILSIESVASIRLLLQSKGNLRVDG